MANTKITLGNIADDAVGLDQLNISNSPSNGQALTYVATSNDLQWATVGVTGIDSSADATAITIDSSEQVGIGGSPSRLFTVTSSQSETYSATGRPTPLAKIANTNAADNNHATLEFITEPTSGNQGVAYIGSTVTGANNADLFFGTRSAASTYNTRMTIKSNGNVGINTTSSDIEGLGNNYKQLMIASTETLYPAMVTFQTPSSSSSSAEIARLHFLNGTNRAASIRVKPDGATDSAYIAFDTMSGGTLNEEVRIQSGGGISFNGDTATANALDDYEEGTWTPSYSGNTGLGSVSGITSASGYYVKVGKLVQVSGIFTMNGSSSNNIDDGDNIRITGLPYESQGGWISQIGTAYTTNAFVNRGSAFGPAYRYSSYYVIQFSSTSGISASWAGDEANTVYFQQTFKIA